MATYRGIPVDSVNYDQKAKTFALFTESGELIAEMTQQAYLSQPMIRSLGHTNGRHRKANSEVHRRPAKQSSLPIDWGTLNRATIFPTWSFVTAFAEPEPTITHSGIRAGEIIAPRAWRVEGDRLFSVYMNDEWIPGEPIQGDPRDKKTHGVHAFKDMGSMDAYLWGKKTEALFDAQIERMLGVPESNRKSLEFVVGTVAMWGEIVEHERGWRGEFGRIASIDAIWGHKGAPHPALALLRARYDAQALA